jgi:RNA polymerase sigma-70 factor (ECF subfamily)
MRATTPSPRVRQLDGFRAAVVQAAAELGPLARRWAADGASAEDLVQATIERALANEARFRAGSNVGAWMRTILYRLAVDETRRVRRERGLRQGYARQLDCDRECAHATEAPAGDAAEPATPAALSRRELRRASLVLSEPFRTTFLLWAEERFSYKEISARLGLPLGTVATRLLRARRTLRNHLAQHAPHGGTPTGAGPRLAARSAPRRRCAADRAS